MLTKSKFKYIQSLTHKKQRDAAGVFVAEGPKIVRELLGGRLELEELFALPAALDGITANPSRITVIDEPTLQRLSFLSTPNQVLAVFRRPEPGPLQLAGRFTLMLDNIQDPGNVGTIVRSADWFGVEQIVCSEDCADVFGPKALQASMGSVARVNVHYRALRPVLQTEVPVYAATLTGESLYEHSPIAEGILLIGNESRGINPELLAIARHQITIPRIGDAESLNAAVATSILLSHLVRR